MKLRYFILYIIYILLESALGEPDHYKYNV